MRHPWVSRHLTLLLLALLTVSAWAVERFPPPDFTESGHVLPTPTTPTSQADWQGLLDLAVLVAALGLAAWLAHRSRQRRSIQILSLAALVYFGFYRLGCVCSIGSIQNVAQAILKPNAPIGIVAIGFFVLPLIAALFWGRVFCSSVCPHGALQDLVLVRAHRVPGWLDRGLRLLPYIYLATSVMLAGLGSAYIICRYDPFVGFFRLSGNMGILVASGLMLGLSTVIGRPYCRYLCPYGALLGLCSRVSRHHITIAPESCTNCRLCEESCPFGAIRQPQTAAMLHAEEPDRISRRRLAVVLLTAPVIILVTAWAGSALGTPLARIDHTVALAEQVWLEESGQTQVTTDGSAAYLMSGQPTADIYEEAQRQRQRYHSSGWWLGGFIGLVIVIALIAYCQRRQHRIYEADRGDCLACGRCFEYCPYELQRRGQMVDLPPPHPPPTRPEPVGDSHGSS